MSEHYVSFPSDHLKCEYIGINAYAVENWELVVTLDGRYSLDELEKIVAYVKTLDVEKERKK